MTKSNKFSPEVRERAVRMVQEHRTDYGMPTSSEMVLEVRDLDSCVWN